VKQKWESRKRRAVSTKALPVTPAAPAGARTAGPTRRAPHVPLPPARAWRIIRAPRYAVNAMSAEEAAIKVQTGDDLFLVFRNQATDTVNVLYRRKDGNFGLIEPEM
jgi:hypothetical protein